MLTLALLTMLVTAPPPDAETRLVVFPFDARSFNPFRSKDADEVFLDTLRQIPGLSLIDSEAMSKQLGVDLAGEARACDNDVLCLVQLGEILSAQKLVLGQLKEGDGDVDLLRIIVVDVEAAKLIDTLLWDIPAGQGLFKSAIAGAARNLFAVPDARIVFALEPPDAELYVYGEMVGDPPYGKEIAFWSGTYYAEIRRKGFLPKTFRLSVRPGVATKVGLSLDKDPLYVEQEDTGRAVRPGLARRSQTQRKEDGIIETEKPIEPESSPFLDALGNPVALSLIGAGGIAVAIGAVLMSGAQSDYNDLSGQTRYSATTASSQDASDVRESARGQYSTGSIVLLGGVAAAATGVTWIIIDAATSAKKDEPRRAHVSGILTPGGGGLTCSVGF